MNYIETTILVKYVPKVLQIGLYGALEILCAQKVVKFLTIIILNDKFVSSKKFSRNSQELNTLNIFLASFSPKTLFY